MTDTTCDKCGMVDRIPTHQFVIYKKIQYYLCSACWEEFQRWFLKPEARR